METRFTAPDITCEGCAGTIKKALGTIPGVSSVSVDVATKAVTIDHGEKVPREELEAALEAQAIPRRTIRPIGRMTEGWRPAVWRGLETRFAEWI